LSWSSKSEAQAFGVQPYTVTWAYEWSRRWLERVGVDGKDLVDLGSGAANPLILWYAKRVREAKLIDLKNPAKPLANTRTIIADLEKPLPLPDGSADLIVSISVLEHLTAEGRLGVMREAQRILRPGGMAFITVSHLFALTDHAIDVLKREPWLNDHGNQISSRLDVAAMLSACPGLRLMGDAETRDFPGFDGFDESRLLANPDLLTMKIADSDWATFPPETNALGIRWAEGAMALVKE